MKLYKEKVINGLKRKIIDYSAIEKVGYGINMIISSRGIFGKTFQAKFHIVLEKWFKDGLKSAWVLNTQGQIDIENKKFFSKLKTDPEAIPYINEVEVKSDGVYMRKAKEPFCYFIALSTSEKYKGTRPDISNIVFDEPHISLSLIINKQNTLFNELINTCQTFSKKARLKVYVLTNSKSMNIPIFIENGISKIKDEITEIKRNGVKTILVYKPKINQKEIEAQFKDNWIYQFGKMSSYSKYAYFNENIFDNEKNLMDEVDVLQDNEWEFKKQYVKIDKNYYSFYFNKKTGQIYFARAFDRLPELEVVCADNQSMEVDVYLNPDLPKYFKNYFTKGTILFDSIGTKINFIKLL